MAAEPATPKRDKHKKDIPEPMSPIVVRPTKRLQSKTSTPARPAAVPEAMAAETAEAGVKRTHEPGSPGGEDGDLTRRYVEALSADTAELLEQFAEDNDVPSYDMVDAHVEPETLRIPSGTPRL